jgi:hypothetical protein
MRIHRLHKTGMSKREMVSVGIVFRQHLPVGTIAMPYPTGSEFDLSLWREVTGAINAAILSLSS